MTSPRYNLVFASDRQPLVIETKNDTTRNSPNQNKSVFLQQLYGEKGP